MKNNQGLQFGCGGLMIGLALVVLLLFMLLFSVRVAVHEEARPARAMVAPHPGENVIIDLGPGEQRGEIVIVHQQLPPEHVVQLQERSWSFFGLGLLPALLLVLLALAMMRGMRRQTKKRPRVGGESLTEADARRFERLLLIEDRLDRRLENLEAILAAQDPAGSRPHRGGH